MYEIIGGIISIILAVFAVIGYRTRSDLKQFLSTLVVITQSLGELLYDLALVLRNIKLVKKPALAGIDAGYTIEFGGDQMAVKSLGEIPGDVSCILSSLDELSKTIPNLGTIIPKK